MILDDNLTFAKAKDAAVTTTKAIKIEGTAYRGLIVGVSAGQDIASLKASLETSATETGTYRTIHEWPEKTGVKAGDTIVNDPMPWTVDKWVRIKLSAACKVNAHLTMDTKLEYPVI